VKLFDRSVDPINAAVAAFVCLTVFIVYLLTMAPTVSFWDCGEFIATSYILGIPHPPGTPLYILIGRLFSIIPLFDDIAARVNFLSVLCNAFAAMVGYLIAVRIGRTLFEETSSLAMRVLLYTGAASGAFFMAFGLTQWNNSVETEVYGMAMLIMMLIVWLTLIYLENRNNSHATKLMALIVFLAVLGVGVHMTTFLIFPIIALFFIFSKETPPKAWFVVAGSIAVGLYLIFALSSRPGEVSPLIPVAAGFILVSLYLLSLAQQPRILLVYAALFAVSLAPLLFSISGRLPQFQSGFNWIGGGAVVVLGLLSVKQLIGLRSNRTESNADSHPITVVSIVSLVSITLAIVTYLPIRGYEAFLLCAVLLVIVLGVMFLRYINVPILIAVIAVSAVVIGVVPFLYAMFFGALTLGVLGVWKKTPGWKEGILLILMGAVGFSVHLFISIRSAEHPYINQNNPSQSFAATVNFIERKQYGSQSMIDRMFERRAEWSNQFGIHQRMGFWAFFSKQYGLGGVHFLALFLIGGFGIWQAVRRKPENGLLMTLLLILSSVGLILYMNFADGTRIDPQTGDDYLEVRDRDYFFTPTFLFFGLAIGLGLSAMVSAIRGACVNFNTSIRKLITAAASVVFLLPVYAVAANYHVCDRSNNYIAFDYAWNILISADKDAVLFTAGDNDTFPLWCLQEVFGVRKDVRNVNLSLANTDWYIKQIRDYMGVDLGWTDEQIDKLTPYRYPDGRIFRVQDQVIDAILVSDNDRPVNFSVTVGGGSRKFNGKEIDSLLEVNGMVFRLKQSGSQMTVNVDRSLFLFSDSGQMAYRGLNDPTVYKDDVTMKVTSNISNGMLMTADSLRRAGDIKGATEFVEFTVEKIPYASDAVDYLATLYAEAANIDGLLRLRATTQIEDKRNLTIIISSAYRQNGKVSEAKEELEALIKDESSYRPALDELIRIYVATSDYSGIMKTLETWMLFNPRDVEINGALEALRADSTLLRQSQGDSQ